MLELARKLIVYPIFFYFVLLGMFSLALLKDDLFLGSMFGLVSAFGVWASIRSIRYKEKPSDICTIAQKKAKAFLVNPIELNEYCKNANADLSSIQKEISMGLKVAYEYRGYTFVENDI